jgi:CubicO group peptidase (beta-lactamase class C family)
MIRTTAALLTITAACYAVDLDSFDRMIEKSMADYNVPGLAIGIIKDGEIIYAKGFGYRNIEEELPVTPETLFGVGSLTKAFTAFAMGTLIEEGLMDWDQHVIDALPAFQLWDKHATQNLTFRDLLSHRSGMARHPYMWYNTTLSSRELLKKLRFLEPAWDIRERFNYGDLMYMTVGLAMEDVSGQSYIDLVTNRIFKPLGMKHTTFSIEEMGKSDEAALGYLERKNELRRMPYRNFSYVAPAAGINTSVEDLMKWMKMLLSGGVHEGKKMLSSGILQEMFAAQIIVSGYAENPETLMSAYGLGWCLHPYRGHYSVSHDGGLDGFTSVLQIFPNDRIGVVVLANKNLTSLPRYLCLEVFDRLADLAPRDWLQLGLEHLKNAEKNSRGTEIVEDVNRKRGTQPSHPLEDYVGEYENPAYGNMKVELNSDGQLVATQNGISCTLEHWHYDVFSILSESQDLLVSREGMKYTFRNNINGDVEELLIPFEQKTKDIIFKKKEKDARFTLDYFRPYIGEYEIYGFTIEIVYRDGILVALIPGQPVYELEPLPMENEFNVRNNNYLVRFLKGDDGLAKEVLLVLPFGAYSADRVKKEE